MYLLKLVIIFSLFTFFYQSKNPWSKKLQEKVKKTVESTIDAKNHTLKAMNINELQETNTTRQFTNNLYQIISSESHMGYIYVDKAPSMKNVFDFAVVFTPDLKIANTKVLIYREQHGKQIGAKRWLQQFKGLTIDSRPRLNENIDGISGATISVTNMTQAVHDLLTDMQYLESKGLFSND